MAAWSRWPLGWGGHVDASNQDDRTRTDQLTWDSSKRAGQRQCCASGRISLTIPLSCRQRNVTAAAASQFLALCAASITARFAPNRVPDSGDIIIAEQRFLNANRRYQV